jgi:hypothetical protein
MESNQFRELQDGWLVQSDKMGAAFLSDLIEWRPGTICCTLEDQSVIYGREEGISRELCRGPALLVC